MKKRSVPRIHACWLPLLASLFFVLACNLTFWRSLVQATHGFSLVHVPLYLLVGTLLTLIFTFVLTIFNIRFVIKPLLTLLLLGTAFASYFMTQYGISIDASMIQNLAETDLGEGRELLGLSMLGTLLLLGILPTTLLWKTELIYPSFRRAMLIKALTLLGIVITSTLLLLMSFKSLAPLVREHRHLRFQLAPSNYIQAINSYIKHRLRQPVRIAVLGADAAKGEVWAGNTRRTVTIIVVGETARSMNFSLNGYARQTNPLLAHQPGLFNFRQVYSCGTATAVSVPCIFSALGRRGYSENRARSQEGLLDVLRHAGFDVLWRDNNSGCKGVCDRIHHEDWSQPVKGDAQCNVEECYDERMLRDLPTIMRNARRDLIIVLHQKGSHGPAYWKRYPAAFRRFGPPCESNELASCTTESIVAAYDNSILYTDHVLSRTIKLLDAAARLDDIDTSMIYFSDHGESLGEDNLYLHGAPYIISPVEQRHVPMMVWLSDSFSRRFKLDRQCLAASSGRELSHDNIFHSTLGMLGISTAVYNPRLDLFHACGGGR